MPHQRKRPSRAARKPSTAALLNQRNALIAFAIFAILAVSVFVVRSSARSNIPQIGRADPSNAAQVALGERLYSTRCASCHGPNLEGGSAVALDVSGPTWRRDDGWIFSIIKDGDLASAMPAFRGGLNDEEIWAIVAYIKSSWPAELRGQQPQVP
jgi:mono/diheme cytochrome c family protein